MALLRVLLIICIDTYLTIVEAMVVSHGIPEGYDHPRSLEVWRFSSSDKSTDVIKSISGIVHCIRDPSISESGVNIIPEWSH